jgi:hypothetical protein
MVRLDVTSWGESLGCVLLFPTNCFPVQKCTQLFGIRQFVLGLLSVFQ